MIPEKGMYQEHLWSKIRGMNVKHSRRAPSIRRRIMSAKKPSNRKQEGIIWYNLHRLVRKTTVDCTVKVVEHIAPTTRRKHEHRFAVRETTSERLVADMDEAEEKW